ncbi:MAG: glycoside hydrolase family 29 [bacterium]|nr:glycoside hydrolase family 29 [bacterium]
MQRRDFISTSAAALSGLACSSFASESASTAVTDSPIPNAAQLAWQRAELGVVFHWDLHVFDGVNYRQGYNRITPIENIDMFHPSEYDMNQWFESVKGMGARFAILTASHETGFRLWQSDVNPYSMRSLKWREGKGDIVKDFVETARRHGIKPGIYLGFRWNSNLGVFDFRVTERSKITQKEYNRLLEQEFEEICSKYGPLFEIWFDGGILAHKDGGPNLLPIFDQYQPDCLFYHSDERREVRWGGSENGTVPYPCWSTVDLETIKTASGSDSKTREQFYQMLKHGDPNGPDWCPAMSDAPLRGSSGRHEWFWEPNDEKAIYSLGDLVDMYDKSVGHNSTLIMGLTPDERGLMPEADTLRCIEWGKAIQERYSQPISKTQGTGDELMLELPEAQRVSTIILEEEIEFGHRIREYTIHAMTGPNVWNPVCSGTCVGQKRIQHFDSIIASKLKLIITNSKERPQIRNFAAYSIG